MLALLLSSAQTQTLFCFSPHPPEKGAQKDWEGMQPGQLTPADCRGISHNMAPCSAYKAGRRRREHSQWHICLPDSLLHVMEPSFPGRWISVYPQNIVDKFFVLFCFCAWLLLYKKLWFCWTVCISTRKFSLLPFWFSSAPYQGRVSRQLTPPHPSHKLYYNKQQNSIFYS